MAHAIVQEWRKIEIQGTNLNDEQRRKWEETMRAETGLQTDIIEKIIQAVILKNIVQGAPQTPIRGFHNR